MRWHDEYMSLLLTLLLVVAVEIGLHRVGGLEGGANAGRLAL